MKNLISNAAEQTAASITANALAIDATNTQTVSESVQNLQNPNVEMQMEQMQQNDSNVAVLDAPAEPQQAQGEAATNETTGESSQAPEASQAQPQGQQQVNDAIVIDTELTYTREELMESRRFTLMAKAAGRQGGFSALSGRVMRDTIGYKFDSMDVMSVLKAMAAPDFLVSYAKTLDRWFSDKKEGVSKASADTIKKNKALYEAALKLTQDPIAFTKLVRALIVLCVRNQDWREKGQNLDLVMNGHRAMLDLFGINVTNSRRIKLTVG